MVSLSLMEPSTEKTKLIDLLLECEFVELAKKMWKRNFSEKLLKQMKVLPDDLSSFLTVIHFSALYSKTIEVTPFLDQEFYKNLINPLSNATSFMLMNFCEHILSVCAAIVNNWLQCDIICQYIAMQHSMGQIIKSVTSVCLSVLAPTRSKFLLNCNVILHRPLYVQLSCTHLIAE